AHVAVSTSSCIGASGSIAAVSGAFLVLFPRATIRVLLFFFIIGLYHIPAVWFIGLYILLDVINQASALFSSGQHRVAYGAHLGGYLFGIVIASLLLATKILPRTEMDMLYLFKQSNRRRKMRQAFEKSPHIWDTNASSPIQAEAVAAQPLKPATPPPPPADPVKTAARSELTRLLQSHQGEEAIARYRALCDDDVHVVLPDSSQLDLANRLFAAGEIELAADAYRSLLKKRADRTTIAGGSTNDIRLLLASLLIRRLNQTKEAAKLLKAIDVSRIDENSRTLRTKLLTEIGEAE
ncbi:MAG: rhomboid family intramembrane serine protease, partial [Phycisphaerales bacterium]|nr:rhomboid family intramembrane serine protease [Phycisphaerales bacterium]